jgi:DNA helicase-2/ATP-dependent DNA helicase PcrA
MLGQVEGMPWMGTFHSLSVKILRRHAELVGLKPSFTILDTDDQLRLLKQLIVAPTSTKSAGRRGCWPG